MTTVPAQTETPVDYTAVLLLVRKQIGALVAFKVPEEEIRESSLLIEDLGLDSLKFVDLTLSLERVLPTSEFPMQYWVDSRIESGLPLNVGGLVEECAAILSRHSAPAVNRELA